MNVGSIPASPAKFTKREKMKPFLMFHFNTKEDERKSIEAQAQMIVDALVQAGKTQKEASEFVERFYDDAYQQGYNNGSDNQYPD